MGRRFQPNDPGDAMSARHTRLPGTGFRIWLGMVATAAAITGFTLAGRIYSDLLAIMMVILAPMVGWFAIFSLWPTGLALWISVRHLCQRRPKTAAAYGFLPAMAVVIAILSGWLAFRVTDWTTTRIHLWQYSQAIDAARHAHQVVKTALGWIDPGPPTRAMFAVSSMPFVGVYIVYAEGTDVAWLDEQADDCKARKRIVTLGNNFYRIAGDC